MQRVKKGSRAITCIAASAALVLFLVSTSPSETHFELSFVPLVLLWVVLYCVCGMVTDIVFRHSQSAFLQLVRIACASVMVLLVMFSALGQLSFLDVAVLFALVLLGSFYFSRTWRT